MPSCLWSCNNLSFPLPAIRLLLWFRDTNTNAVFVAEPQFCWRAARVRESREPAPRMGRVSFVQTAGGGKLFPAQISGPPAALAAHQPVARFVTLKGQWG